MSLPLICASLWVLTALATTAFPKSLQKTTAMIMLTLTIPLLIWIFASHPSWVGALCLLAVLSMYRAPFVRVAQKVSTRLK